MSFEINAREVLKHLNEMGYTDITATQLKEFIRDLKILIKYDHKKQTLKEAENMYPKLYSNSYNTCNGDADFTSISQEFYASLCKNNNNDIKESRLDEENAYKRKSNSNPITQTQYSNTNLYHHINTNYNDNDDIPKTPFYSNILTCSNLSYFDEDLQTNSNICDIYNDSDVGYVDTEREEYLSKVFNNLYSNSTVSSRAKIRNLKNHSVKYKETDILGRDVQSLSAVSSATDTSEGVKYSTEYNKKLRSVRSEPVRNAKNRLNVLTSLSQLNSNEQEMQGIVGSENIKFKPKIIKGTDSEESVMSESIRMEKKCGSQQRSRPKSSDTEIKPKFSFIRPRQVVRSIKSDPVSLYHQYQEEWKKIKLPGEDKRFNLRWAVREKMLGGHDIDARRSSSTGKASKRSVSFLN